MILGVGMDARWLADLRQATLGGDWAWIERLAEQVRVEYPALAWRLTELAHDFGHEEIMRLIEDATGG